MTMTSQYYTHAYVDDSANACGSKDAGMAPGAWVVVMSEGECVDQCPGLESILSPLTSYIYLKSLTLVYARLTEYDIFTTPS